MEEKYDTQLLHLKMEAKETRIKKSVFESISPSKDGGNGNKIKTKRIIYTGISVNRQTPGP
jgi:hypothetical protein